MPGIRAYIQGPAIKWCSKKVLGVKVSYPCGLKWSSKSEWGFGKIQLAGDGKMRNLLAMLGDVPDPTPPEMGDCHLEQITWESAKANFGGFAEEESEIRSTKITFRNLGGSGRQYHSKTFEGSSESWQGKLSTPPRHGDKVVACVDVENTFGGVSSKCSAPVLWDGKAPTVKNFVTINPFSGNWRLPPSKCRNEHFLTGVWPNRTACTVFTNSTDTLRFGLRLSEYPDGSSFKSVDYAISWVVKCPNAGKDDKRQADCSCPEIEGSSLPWTPIGHAERLTLGDVSTRILEVIAKEIKLQNGLAHYVNIKMCDHMNNCRITTNAYPILIDETPPPLPTVFVADRHHPCVFPPYKQQVVTAASPHAPLRSRAPLLLLSCPDLLLTSPDLPHPRVVLAVLPVEDPHRPDLALQRGRQHAWPAWKGRRKVRRQRARPPRPHRSRVGRALCRDEYLPPAAGRPARAQV